MTIRRTVEKCEELRAGKKISWRSLCRGTVPYSSLMHWKKRIRSGQAPVFKRGPRKVEPLDLEQFRREVAALPHGRRRTHGTSALYERWQKHVSRREVLRMAARFRQEKAQDLQRVLWLLPGLTWSIDGTQCERNCKIVPVQDLASHYRLPPLLSSREDGREIAEHLEKLFAQFGPPLLLKKDNGSPYNNQFVDQLLHRHSVLPLNSPPQYPRYNGSAEKGMRDLKDALFDRLLHQEARLDAATASHLEATIQELNHRSSRSLNGQTPCEFFHNRACRWQANVRQRQQILRLLLTNYWETIAKVPNPTQPRCAAHWRHTVESWLRCQGLIEVRLNQKPNVSTHSTKFWSHN